METGRPGTQIGSMHTSAKTLSQLLATFGSVMDIVPDGIVVVLPSGAVAYANKAAERFIGNPKEELVGTHVKDIERSVWEDLAKVFQDGEPRIGIRTLIQGKLYIINSLPLKFLNGIEGVVSFFQAVFVYDKYAMELESAREMAQLLDSIMESSYDGLWITDGNGKVVKLNKAAERITGCSAEEILGRNVSELVSKGYVDESVTMQVLKRKTTVTLVQTTKADKTVLATGNPILNSEGEIEVIIINDRDITELDRIRRELDESKALVDQYKSELLDFHLRDLQSNFFICRSKEMESIYERALRVARFDSTVLITGESGVGKGLLAKLIHQKSDRSDGPFVRVDCASIVDTLFESELFGYEKGAFTGASTKGKPGLVEIAEGGTLFFDEISEAPLSQQVKLLRFLDEKCIMRVGGSAVRAVDVRVIAATNRDLAEQVKKNLFREDLFYRLNVVSLAIPPLRGRTQDILDLISFFAKKFRSRHNLDRSIDREALDALLLYEYPGNVRELENIVESIMVLGRGDLVTLSELPSPVRRLVDSAQFRQVIDQGSLKNAIDQLELEQIAKAVRKYGSQQKAARHLGMNQSTISRKMKRYTGA
jgi:PAS domain S-box-containing protein